MSFTKRLMAQGDWSVQLAPTTPRWVRRIIEISEDEGHGFNSVICTPARYNLADIDDDDLIDAADYIGVHRANEGLTMSGAGLESLVADEYGKYGANTTSAADQPFASWISDLATSVGVITAGTVESIAGDIDYSPEEPIDPWAILAFICNAAGAEWRLNNDMSLDAGRAATLFGTTPKAVVGAVGRGGVEPGGYRGVIGGVHLLTHLEDYANTAKVYDGAGSNGTDTRGSLPYIDFTGGFAGPTVHLVVSGADPTDLNALATARLVYGDDVLKRIYRVDGLGTTRPLEHIGGPGEYLYVFDPAQLILDKTNQITYRAGPVWPKKLRLMAVTTPLRRGQGWYYRYWDATLATPAFATIDITDHIDWAAEATLEASIEVGHPMATWMTTQRTRYEDWLTNR